MFCPMICTGPGTTCTHWAGDRLPEDSSTKVGAATGQNMISELPLICALTALAG